MAIIINGKQIADQIKLEIAEQVRAMKAEGLRPPHLAAVLVGHDGASETYVASKIKDCKEVGFGSSLFRFENSISETALLAQINELNENPEIDGFIVQLPLPDHISVQKVTEAIAPEKDVDGFHPVNVGRLNKGLPSFVSATPFGITMLLSRYNIPTEGKHCVVLGRSNIVGSPMSILMGQNTYPGNCTVTLCHSKTKNIETYTRSADILIAALGKPGFVKDDMVKKGVVIIDVGITRVEANNEKGYRISGDVDYEGVFQKASYITPVPGGVGPMTRVALLQNTLKAARREVFS